MQNTISTTGAARVELLAAGKDVNNIVSSIDNSSVENAEQHMDAKLAKINRVLKPSQFALP